MCIQPATMSLASLPSPLPVTHSGTMSVMQTDHYILHMPPPSLPPSLRNPPMHPSLPPSLEIYLSTFVPVSLGH